MKLPISKLPKLPQRRKFITLAEANSANYVLNSHAPEENSTSLFDRSNSGLLDLLVAEGKEDVAASARQEELPAMEESNEDELHKAVQMMKTKKKLLAQLAEQCPVDSIWKSSKSEHSSFHESSNPSRTCRFCDRDFPSGRALGGHMRVHGALLSEECIFKNTVELKGIRSPPCELSETLGSAIHASRKAVQVEKIKPGSLTSSSSNSKMSCTSEVPHKTICKLQVGRRGQELAHEEKQDEEAETGRVSRTVNLSSFDECSGYLVSTKAGDELLLGYGDGSSHHFLTGKRKSASALYKLRRNPKPNHRFRDQEMGEPNAIWPAPNQMASSGAYITTHRSRSPSPERARSCSECGKVFLSWKALFGHMRCHPERDWRGIQRPERSLELDSAPRPIAPKAAIYAEVSSLNANNIANCTEQIAGFSVPHLANKLEEPSDKAHHIQEGAFNSNLLIKSAASDDVAEESVNPSAGELLDVEPRQQLMKIEEIIHTKDQHASKRSSKNKSMKRKADHVGPQSSKHPRDDWCPSWLTRNKRSRRSRVLRSYSDQNMSLASETTSNELRLSQLTPELDTQDDLDMANCLVMLSNAGAVLTQDVEKISCWDLTQQPVDKEHAKRVCRDGTGSIAQAHVEIHGSSRAGPDDNFDIDELEGGAATFTEINDIDAEYHENSVISLNAGVKYQCSTCKKCFNSHQALGGHRASHRKMKGCFAQTKNSAKETQESNEQNVTEDGFGAQESIEMWQEGPLGRAGGSLLQQEEERGNTCEGTTLNHSSKKKIKGHECSICHRIFASGQALGGHKRCHWNGDRFMADTASVASSNKQASLDGSASKECATRFAKEDAIDLNLPAPLDEDEIEETTFGMPINAQVKDEMQLLSTEKRKDTLVIGNSGVTTKWNDVCDNWKIKDLIGGKKGVSLLRETEIEARCRFDQRSPMWTQSAVGT